MNNLSPLKKAILYGINLNPCASQQETVDNVNIACSPRAAHIVSSTQSGFSLGRGYVLPAAKK
jgi:pseudouridine kinase